MKNSFKVVVVIFSLVVLFVLAITCLPKGNDLVKWENDMIKVEQHNKNVNKGIGLLENNSYIYNVKKY